jgi:hypothetical protein
MEAWRAQAMNKRRKEDLFVKSLVEVSLREVILGRYCILKV